VDNVVNLHGSGGEGWKRIALALACGPDAAKPPPHDTTVVRGVAHTGSISLIYGKPKSGKAFLATDLALAVAQPAKPAWMGHRIQQHGVVLYVACEGHGGYWKRLAAVIEPIHDNFVLATGRPTLLKSRDGYQWVPNIQDILDAIEAVRDQLGSVPILIVVDTVFRSFGGGNVNDSAHMNAYLAGIQALADQGIALILVHHATKSNGTPAGSVSLMGAADTIVLVEKHLDAIRSFTVEEAKDDADAPAYAFRLDVVDDIQDAAGEFVSSCRVVDLGPKTDANTTAPGGRKPKPERRDAILELLRKLAAEADDGRVNIIDWREQAYKHVLGQFEKTDSKLKAFNRAYAKMMDGGQITADGAWITPA
jgi:hypothetical protein